MPVQQRECGGDQLRADVVEDVTAAARERDAVAAERRARRGVERPLADRDVDRAAGAAGPAGDRRDQRQLVLGRQPALDAARPKRPMAEVAEALRDGARWVWGPTYVNGGVAWETALPAEWPAFADVIRKATHPLVLATGPGNRNADSGIREPVAVKAGDEVVFIADGGAEIEVGGERCRIVREGEVLAVKGKAK